MKILTVDIGTGTQDIYLYNSRLDLENGFKLVIPSPTMIVHRKLKEATGRGEAVLLSGVTMGGGPSAWAAEAHIRAGLPLYATEEAARSFNDDLEAVQAMGIQVVSEDEASRLPARPDTTHRTTRLRLSRYRWRPGAIRRFVGVAGGAQQSASHSQWEAKSTAAQGQLSLF